MMDLAIPLNWRQIFARTTPSDAVDPKAEIPSFEHIIQDAQLLLSYAATTGTTLNDVDVKILNDEIQKASVDKLGNHNYLPLGYSECKLLREVRTRAAPGMTPAVSWS
jgi:hypothetical protein